MISINSSDDAYGFSSKISDNEIYIQNANGFLLVFFFAWGISLLSYSMPHTLNFTLDRGYN
jgi:hypothetical protein